MLLVTSHFALTDFKIFIFIFRFQHFNFDICRWEFLCFYLAQRLLSFMYRLMFFINSGGFQLFFNYEYIFYPFFVLFSFWYFHYEYVGALKGVPRFSEALLIFLLFFSLCSSDCIICINLSIKPSLIIFSPVSEQLFFQPVFGQRLCLSLLCQ